jgi:hypothetical protein
MKTQKLKFWVTLMLQKFFNRKQIIDLAKKINEKTNKEYQKNKFLENIIHLKYLSNLDFRVIIRSLKNK